MAIGTIETFAARFPPRHPLVVTLLVISTIEPLSETDPASTCAPVSCSASRRGAEDLKPVPTG
jgi:hypothetical protein